MAEIVLLGDVVASYGSMWARVANTRDLPSVQIKDRFREQGFGEGAEELEVEGIDLSPVSGASRIFFRRAANNTKAEVHRLGAVMLQTNGEMVRFDSEDPTDLARWLQQANQTVANANTATATASVSNLPQNVNGAIAEESSQPVKRGRGRPPGSRNKPKPPLQRVTVPAWPNV